MRLLNQTTRFSSSAGRWAWLVAAAIVLAALAAADGRIRSLVGNTALLVLGAWLVSLPLGTLAAILFARTDLGARRAAAALLGGILFVPLYLHAAAWEAGFGLQGWATLALGRGAWLEGFSAAAWIHGVASVPWVALIVGTGLRLVEPELEEQALLDGAPRDVLVRVTLPASLGAVGVAALWVAVTTSSEIAVTDLFGVRTFAEEIYTQTAIGPQEVNGALVGPPGFLPTLLVTALAVLGGLVILLAITSAGRPQTLRGPFLYPLGRWGPVASGIVALAVLLVVGIPAINLVSKAGIVVNQTAAGRVRTWSLEKCVLVVGGAPWRYRQEFGWTIMIGSLAATAAVLAGTILAWIARFEGIGRKLVWTLVAAGLAAPGPAIGLAVIWLLNRPGAPLLIFLYDQSILAPLAAQTIRALPPAVLVMWFAFQSIPRSVIDAALVDGAGSWGVLWRVALPWKRSATIAAWLLAAVVAIGDLSASILTVPPGVPLLPVRIFTLLHYGVEDQVAGICLALSAGFAASGWLVALALAAVVGRVGAGRAEGRSGAPR